MPRRQRRRQRRARNSANPAKEQDEDPSSQCGVCFSDGNLASEVVADHSMPLQQPEQEAEPSFQCGICFSDDIPASEVVAKPCKCAISYCKECWNRTMCKQAPRCPSCRAGIGFDYDSEKGEPKFLLYDKSERSAEGMIVFPGSYKSGDSMQGPIPMFLHKKMQERSKPAMMKLLRCQSLTGAGPCVCGGKNCFRRMTMEERRSKARFPATFAPSCDCCDKKMYKPGCVEAGQSVLIGTHIWSCDQVSVVHICSIEVCDECMSGFLPSS